jgi:hypothetical protein
VDGVGKLEFLQNLALFSPVKKWIIQFISGVSFGDEIHSVCRGG